MSWVRVLDDWINLDHIAKLEVFHADNYSDGSRRVVFIFPNGKVKGVYTLSRGQWHELKAKLEELKT